LEFEQGIFISDINKLIITLPSSVSNNSKSRISLLTIFANNTGIIIWVGCEKMLRIVVAVNDDFSQGIVHMYILASFTHKMLQELSQQA
jgi:hypothetical protein